MGCQRQFTQGCGLERRADCREACRAKAGKGGVANISRNLALTIEYDGSAFHGWQVQNEFRTVEAELTKALAAVTYQSVKLFAASRTDAGVHARGQSAHFITECPFPVARLHGALNQILPEDIAVLDIQEKSLEFHARHDAEGKWYRYGVIQREMPPALDRAHFLFIHEKLRLGPMEEAAKLLLGTHDFSSFGVNSGTEPESTTKTMYHVGVVRQAPYFYFDIVGNSFLYRMVRSIVGTLLDVGLGKRKPQSVADAIEKKDRCAAGFTAAAHGLCLMKVFYEDPSKFIPPVIAP